MLVLDTNFNAIFDHDIILLVVPQDVGIEIWHVWTIHDSLNQVDAMCYGHINGKGLEIFMKLISKL